MTSGVRDTVTVSSNALRALMILFDTYWHDTALLDPGDAFPLHSLISYQDAAMLEASCRQIEPFEAELRAALDA